MADRKIYYFEQKVLEDELNDGFALLEAADRALAVDLGLVGILSGLGVSQHAAGADLTVDVALGKALDKDGKRLNVTALQNVDLSVDEGNVSTVVTGVGKSKIVSLFLAFDRTLADPRTDGNSNTIYYSQPETFKFVVRQGAEAVSPTPVALDPSMILLADVTRTQGITTITTPNINIVGRREDWCVRAGATYALRNGTPISAIFAILDDLNALVADLASTGDAMTGGAVYAGTSGIFSLAASTLRAQLRSIADQLDHGKRRSISRNVANGTTTIDSGQNDVHIFVDTTAGTATLNLPAPAAGREIHVWDAGNLFGTNNCTLHRNAAEKINFVAGDLALSTNGQHVTISSNGTDWFVK